MRINVAEIIITKWMSSITRLNRIGNEYIKSILEVTKIIGKVRESRLR